jgi:hypothetical protein
MPTTLAWRTCKFANAAVKASDRPSHDEGVTEELMRSTLRALADNVSTTAFANGRYASSSTMVMKVRPEPLSERIAMPFDECCGGEFSLISVPATEGNGSSLLSLHTLYKPRSFHYLWIQPDLLD